MTDVENSDDERYANESFENESDVDVPEMSEFESETSDNSDDDDDEDDELPSVKINTGPIKRNGFTNTFPNINQTDVVPFASSSDEEDDVIVGQTLAEINTPSMLFEDEPPIPAKRYSLSKKNGYNSPTNSLEAETQESSEEISEEEDEEEQVLQRIQDMEEKYLLQNSAKTPKHEILEKTKCLDGKRQKEVQRSDEEKTDSENKSEAEDYKNDNGEEFASEEDNRKVSVLNNENYSSDNNSEASNSSDIQCVFKEKSRNSIDQNNLMQLIKNSLTNLQIASSSGNGNELLKIDPMPLLKSINTQTLDTSNISYDQITLTVLNVLKSTCFQAEEAEVIQEHKQKLENKHDDDIGKPTETKNPSENGNEIEIVQYKDDFEEEKEIEVEEIQNGEQYADDVYYDGQFDYHITSKTPTSFNSDDYIFHANFIKQFHRTSSTDKLSRVKTHPRKSMSFSNERMREIERHNQILLRKILTQKPTYNLKSKSSQSSLQKIPSQTNHRLTTSAVNRKKQQRQIDMDNQVLKRKIEAIALRRRPVI